MFIRAVLLVCSVQCALFTSDSDIVKKSATDCICLCVRFIETWSYESAQVLGQSDASHDTRPTRNIWLTCNVFACIFLLQCLQATILYGQAFMLWYLISEVGTSSPHPLF